MAEIFFKSFTRILTEQYVSWNNILCPAIPHFPIQYCKCPRESTRIPAQLMDSTFISQDVSARLLAPDHHSNLKTHYFNSSCIDAWQLQLKCYLKTEDFMKKGREKKNKEKRHKTHVKIPL